jgi:hypothetical protein
MLVAVTVTGPGAAGAKKTALVAFVVVKEPAEADQDTPALPMSFATVACREMDCPIVRPPRLGERVTLMLPEEAGTTVMVAADERAGSRIDCAVSVTAAGFGTAAGAV